MTNNLSPVGTVNGADSVDQAGDGANGSAASIDPGLIARTRSRAGRRPGNPQTREAIIEIAERAFTGPDAHRTTATSIANEAGVDPAMINYFFGSKRGLLCEVMSRLLDPGMRRERLNAAVDDDAEGNGDFTERVIRESFRMWDDDPGVRRMLARLMIIAGEDAAPADLLQALQATLQEVVEKYLVEHGRSNEDARATAAVFVAMHAGIGYNRYVICAPGIAEMPVEQLIARYTPALRGLLAQ